ncbi:MAG: hypothetical protein CL675_13195 [Bdellovibrionaceae bacterium]|nr:hypothetical protein [Pseudobdellovibrionaceae bacterium]
MIEEIMKSLIISCWVLCFAATAFAEAGYRVQIHQMAGFENPNSVIYRDVSDGQLPTGRYYLRAGSRNPTYPSQVLGRFQLNPQRLSRLQAGEALDLNKAMTSPYDFTLFVPERLLTDGQVEFELSIGVPDPLLPNIHADTWFAIDVSAGELQEIHWLGLRFMVEIQPAEFQPNFPESVEAYRSILFRFDHLKVSDRIDFSCQAKATYFRQEVDQYLAGISQVESPELQQQLRERLQAHLLKLKNTPVAKQWFKWAIGKVAGSSHCSFSPELFQL